MDVIFKETKPEKAEMYNSGEGDFKTGEDLWRDEQTYKCPVKRESVFGAAVDKNNVIFNDKLVLKKVVIKKHSSQFDWEKEIYAGVYVVRGVRGGPIKIGFSKDVNARMIALESNQPYPLEILYVIRNAGHDFERYMHRNLKKYRTKGEWFEYDDTVKQKIEELIKNYRFF